MLSETNFIRIITFLYPLTILVGGIGNLSIGDKTPMLLYSDIYLFALSSIYVVNCLMARERLVIDKPVTVLFIIYIYANVVSTLVNMSTVTNMLLSTKVAFNGYLTYIIFITLLNSRRNIFVVELLLVLFPALLTCVIITSLIYSPVGIDVTSKEMIDVGWGKSNYLASFFAMLSLINIGLIVRTNKIIVKFILFLVFIVQMIGLIITMSRGAMLCLVLSVFFMLALLLFTKYRNQMLLIVSTVGVSVVIILNYVIPERILDLLTDLIVYRAKSSDDERIALMKSAMTDFMDNPVFGIGPFETKTLISRYDVMPHNFVLQQFAEIGCFGSIVFIAILAIFIYRAYKSCLNSKDVLDIFILGSLLSTLAHGLIELTFPGAQYMTMFWILMALIYCKYNNCDMSSAYK